MGCSVYTLRMSSSTTISILVVCYSTMTSLAMQSGKYAMLTDSSGAQVCSNDPPSQVLPMYPEGDMQCGAQCTVSSCSYYQFKSSAPIQCQLYDQFLVNFTKIADCTARLQNAAVDCSFPFTFNGTLYYGRAPGIRCLTVNRTAAGIYNGNTVTGVINNTVSIGNQSVPVQSIFGWIIWMRRVLSGSYNWNATWATYKNGFGFVGDSNYWLGLERVHQLTSTAKYRLRIEMKVQSTGKWISVEYWSFTVGDEASSKYQLNVNGFSGDARNGLQYSTLSPCPSYYFHNGMQFSAIDADNDVLASGSSPSCAANNGGGWWYNACMAVCLTCSSGRWLAATSACATSSLMEARMMMKPQY